MTILYHFPNRLKQRHSLKQTRITNLGRLFGSSNRSPHCCLILIGAGLLGRLSHASCRPNQTATTRLPVASSKSTPLDLWPGKRLGWLAAILIAASSHPWRQTASSIFLLLPTPVLLLDKLLLLLLGAGRSCPNVFLVGPAPTATPASAAWNVLLPWHPLRRQWRLGKAAVLLMQCTAAAAEAVTNIMSNSISRI